MLVFCSQISIAEAVPGGGGALLVTAIGTYSISICAVLKWLLLPDSAYKTVEVIDHAVAESKTLISMIMDTLLTWFVEGCWMDALYLSLHFAGRLHSLGL